ncbi:MAG: hypothetical protein WA131_05725 [Desulfitobacteriaceae bacterium]
MNSSYLKLLNILASALIGLNLGFCLALLLAQWTWLELRVNAGLLILVGLLFGFIYGLFISLKRPLLRGRFSVVALLLAGLVSGRGVENLPILLGSMFREGILISSLTLKVADLMVVGIALLTVVAAWGLSRLRCSGRN